MTGRYLKVGLVVCLILLMMVTAAQALAVSSIAPTSGKAGTTVSATVSGSGFARGAQVELQKAGKPTIYGTGEAVYGTTGIACKFSIPASAAMGAWNVVVRSGGRTVVRWNAFTVSKPIPRIWFTYIPPGGSSIPYVKGKVSGVTFSQYRIVLFIRVRGYWWGAKPYWSTPLTIIQPPGDWTTTFITGGVDREATGFAAYLVPAGYRPLELHGTSSLPSSMNGFPHAFTSR